MKMEEKKEKEIAVVSFGKTKKLEQKILDFVHQQGHRAVLVVCSTLEEYLMRVVSECRQIVQRDHQKLSQEFVSEDSLEKRVIFVEEWGNLSFMTANKIRGMECGNPADEYTITMIREHNNAQGISLSSSILSLELSLRIVDLFLTQKFSGEERHKRRLAVIN